MLQILRWRAVQGRYGRVLTHTESAEALVGSSAARDKNTEPLSRVVEDFFCYSGSEKGSRCRVR